MDIWVEVLPKPHLRTFVECVWYTEPVLDTRFEIVPDGSVDACFVLSERPRALYCSARQRGRASMNWKQARLTLASASVPATRQYSSRRESQIWPIHSSPFPDFLGWARSKSWKQGISPSDGHASNRRWWQLSPRERIEQLAHWVMRSPRLTPGTATYGSAIWQRRATWVSGS